MDEMNRHDNDEFYDGSDEIELEIKDHRSDEDFEKMLAELNGQTYTPKSAPQPERNTGKPARTEGKNSYEPVFNGLKTSRSPQEKTQKPKRHDEETSRLEFERDQRERAEAEKRKRMLEAQKDREDNQNKMLDQIADIWNLPELNSGGSLTLNIKTEQRKEIHIVMPEKNKGNRQRSDGQQSRNSSNKLSAEPKTIEMQRLTPQQRTAIQEKARSGAAQNSRRNTSQRKNAENTQTSPQSAPNTKRSPTPGQGGTVPPRKRPPQGAQGAPNGKPRDPNRRKAVPTSAAVIDDFGTAPAKTSESTLSPDEIRRKQSAIVNVIVCCTIFFGLGLFLLFCNRQKGFISSENRNLAEKPKLKVSTVLDGSYFSDLTKWYTDTIPGREELKPVSSKFNNLFGIHMDDVKISNGGLAPTKKETLDPEKAVTTTEVTINTDFTNKSTEVTTTKKKKKSTTTEELAEVPEVLDDGEWIGSVIVSGKGKDVRAMSAFNGTFAAGEFYAQTINKYKADLGDSVNVYTMNMPSAGAYYMPKNLADQFTSQHDCITNIGNNLDGIVNIDVYNALAKHVKEYIYSRTDHHWQPLGAYYAAQVFAEKAKFDFPDLSTYEECKIDNFVGTMYAYSDYDEELNQNPDTFIYHKPDNINNITTYNYDEWFGGKTEGMLFHEYASGINCYSCILGTDDIIAEIDTDVHNGRKLVIIKDSFGNALVPYLTHGFEKIYVLDFRFFQLNAVDFVEQVGATDLLFAVSLGAAHTEGHVNMIGNIRIQNPGQEIYVEPDAPTPAAETAQAEQPQEDEAADDEYYGEDDGYENW